MMAGAVLAALSILEDTQQKKEGAAAPLFFQPPKGTISINHFYGPDMIPDCAPRAPVRR